MRYEWKLTIGASTFLVILFIVYWFLSYEHTGTVLLGFSFAAYGMLGAFLLMEWVKRRPAKGKPPIPRPEDDPDATHADGAGEVDFFPSASIWPAGMALGAITVAIGTIYGLWYFLIGLVLVAGAVIGFVVEAEAGQDAMDELHAEAARAAAGELDGEEHGAGGHGAAPAGAGGTPGAEAAEVEGGGEAHEPVQPPS